MPVVLVLLIVVLAVLVWRHTSSRRSGGGPQLRPRHLGPDDDPDFLRELSRRTRRDDDLS